MFPCRKCFPGDQRIRSPYCLFCRERCIYFHCDQIFCGDSERIIYDATRFTDLCDRVLLPKQIDTRKWWWRELFYYRPSLCEDIFCLRKYTLILGHARAYVMFRTFWNNKILDALAGLWKRRGKKERGEKKRGANEREDFYFLSPPFSLTASLSLLDIVFVRISRALLPQSRSLHFFSF